MDLEDIRRRINRIDSKIMEMLNERMELAIRTKRLKKQVLDSEREKAILAKVDEYSRCLINSDFGKKIFDEILIESKSLQQQENKLIGFLGEHGSFGEEAAKKYGPDLVPIPYSEVVEVFEGIEKDNIDIGILPTENSLEGSVSDVNDLLIQRDLKIVGETFLPVSYCLLTLPETNLQEIKVVFSSSRALSECRDFITRKHFTASPFSDAAGAAKMLSNTKPKAAATIASELCAGLYNLKIVEKNISGDKTTFTRFLVLSKDESMLKGDKCSITFSMKNEVGALAKILTILAENGSNVTRIGSQPTKNIPGNYDFLLDFTGSIKEKTTKDAVENIKKYTSSIKFLGCYRGALL